MPHHLVCLMHAVPALRLLSDRADIRSSVASVAIAWLGGKDCYVLCAVSQMRVTTCMRRRGGKMTGRELEPYDRCMEKGVDYLIAASDVAGYEMAPFDIWCKYFADRSEKDPPSRVVEILSRRGIQYEEAVRRTKYPDAFVVDNESRTKDERARFDPVAAGEKVLAQCSSTSFKKGVELMKAGKAVIAACPLYDLRHGMCGTPDILERADGQSIFGPYHYVVKEIKSSQKIGRRPKMQAAFYNLLMGRIQGRVPEKFHIIDGNGEENTFVFSDYEAALNTALAGIAGIRDETETPTPTYGSSAYPWRAFGNKMAVEAGDISIIGSMRKQDLDALRRNGIRTIQDMLSCEAPEISSRCKIDFKTVCNYMRLARSLASKRLIRRANAKVQLQKRQTEVYLDICAHRKKEGGAGGPAVYMTGALVRNGRNERFVSFIADDAGGMVDNILGLVEGAKDCAVYHSNKYNYDLLIEDMERYRADTGTIRSIMSGEMIINLRGMAAALYTFPVPRLDIGSIAGYVGFQRSSPEIDPHLLYLIYGEYRKNAGTCADILKIIQENSADNCMAMAAVKDWLVKAQ